MKKILSMILAIVMIAGVVSGCSSKKPDAAVEVKAIGDYILSTDTGRLTMFGSAGQVLSDIDLGGNPKSDFIYAIDEGRIYSSNLTEITTYPQIIYAVDRTTRKMSVVLSNKDNLKIMRDYILDESNIENLYGYNGLVFYSTKNQKTKANPYSIVRPQVLSKDGKIGVANSIPINTAQTSTFIHMENLSVDFLQFTGLSNMVDQLSIDFLNYPKTEAATFEIPGDISSWTANTTHIYFFDNLKMGQYDMKTNQLELHYGPISSKDVSYIDGINKRTYNISDFGEGSTKSLLMVTDYDKMNVDKIIDLGYANPMTMTVDKTSNIYISFKNTQSQKNYSQLKAYRYGDYAEMYSVGVPYLPTKILSKDGNVYLFNPYEPNFYMGAIGSSSFSELAKDPNGHEKYTDMFIANPTYSADYLYDESGKMVNRENFYVNLDGKIINANGDRINNRGQRIDEAGKPINKDGDYIDRYNNILDKNDKIIKYTPDGNGNRYNARGQFVSEDGTVLVRNDLGDWVLPTQLEEKIVIEGHYDEHGNFIINQGVLEKYPDAYKLWMEQKETNIDVPEETSSSSSAESSSNSSSSSSQADIASSEAK